MEGDDSLDLSSTMPLQIPDPDGNNIPLDEFEENEEIEGDCESLFTIVITTSSTPLLPAGSKAEALNVIFVLPKL